MMLSDSDDRCLRDLEEQLTVHDEVFVDAFRSGSSQRAIEQTLQAAAAAPSLFNSQSWLIRTVGNTVLICTDRGRRLPVHDPRDRELLIACGSFAVYAEIALQVAGLKPCSPPDRPFAGRWSPTRAPD